MSGDSYKLTFPALIVKAPYAAAMVQGLPLRSEPSKLVYKTVEIRGARCRTDYRGPVAIFCSNSYDYGVEDHFTWWHASQTGKPGKLKVSPADELHVRAWCQYAHAWRYRIHGFVQLHDVLFSDDLLRSKQTKLLHQLHREATDYNAQWMAELEYRPQVYLRVSSLYQYPLADGPRFADVCAGCQATPPHNATACHVNWQKVALPSAAVPPIALKAQKEAQPWLP